MFSSYGSFVDVKKTYQMMLWKNFKKKIDP